MTHKEPLVYKAFNTYTLASSGLFLVDTIPNIHIEKEFKVSNGFRLQKLKKNLQPMHLDNPCSALEHLSFILPFEYFMSTSCLFTKCERYVTYVAISQAYFPKQSHEMHMGVTDGTESRGYQTYSCLICLALVPQLFLEFLVML